MYIYTFVVNFMDEDFNGNCQEAIRQGVTCANTYKEAASNIVDYYGDNEINNMQLECLDEGDVVEISEAEVKRIKEEHF